jgi:polysaccharide deacetylase family protein (PEP-CTERM system associated)
LIPELRMIQEPQGGPVVGRSPGEHDVRGWPTSPRSTSSEVSGAAVTCTALVRPPVDGAPLAAFTVDVEDWYQSCIDYDAPITERVVRNTDKVLQMLEECGGVKGTFFVQGLVAERFPHLVESLVADGHEVQSHGHSHRPLYAMDRKTLRDELDRARKTVEDASGARVTAFRAQDFSIVQENLWALDVLVECGFEIDSSIFPMSAGRYGIAGWELAPHRVSVEQGAEIIELSDYAGRAPRRTRLSQGLGRSGTARLFGDLLSALPFGRFDSVLRGWGVT